MYIILSLGFRHFFWIFVVHWKDLNNRSFIKLTTRFRLKLNNFIKIL